MNGTIGEDVGLKDKQRKLLTGKGHQQLHRHHQIPTPSMTKWGNEKSNNIEKKTYLIIFICSN
jgi:hypothetical protein